MIVAGTGHRPKDCSHSEAMVRQLANNKLRLTSGVSVFICGMASGFDLWAGTEAVDLGLEVWAAKPWTGHTPRKGDEELYQKILDNASRIINVTEVDAYPGPWVYPVRNHWMVDNADVVMAYYNGAQKGGTFECFEYAKKKGKKIANIINDPPF
jgi:uncharacterized phage-like protein YoqJ